MTTDLLRNLQDRANNRGLVMVREGRLQTELKITGDELRANLKRLEESGLTEILAPGAFIVLKLRIWPGKRENIANSSAFPHSYSFQSKLSPSKQLKKSNSYSGDAKSPPLLQDILDTLGESDPTLFAKAIEHYPEPVIRAALDRVRNAKSIHKSPTALFRYLLPRIAKEIPSRSN
jgi:hypothetical protein